MSFFFLALLVFFKRSAKTYFVALSFCGALFAYVGQVGDGIDFNSLEAIETLRAARFALVFDCWRNRSNPR
jgi:hypothetical protein